MVRSLRLLVSCIAVVFAIPLCGLAGQYSVPVDTTPRLYSSPFAAADGSSLMLSNLVATPEGRLTVYAWDPTNVVYKVYTRSAAGAWSGNAGSARIARGEGFFLQSTNAWTVTFTGSLATASTVTSSYSQAGYHFAGFPFLSHVALTNMGMTNITSYVFGHRIRIFNPTTLVYVTCFYDAVGDLGGGWQDIEDPGKPFPYVLAPMEGFILEMPNATTMTWRATMP